MHLIFFFKGKRGGGGKKYVSQKMSRAQRMLLDNLSSTTSWPTFHRNIIDVKKKMSACCKKRFVEKILTLVTSEFSDPNFWKYLLSFNKW